MSERQSNVKTACSQFVMFFLVLTALLLAGWGLSVLVWLHWLPRQSDSLLYYFLIGLFAIVAVQSAEPDRRYRLRWTVVLAVVASWYLNVSASATFQQRAARVFSDPFFAFRPTGTLPLIVVFAVVAYYLPWLRQLLNSINSSMRRTKNGESSSD